MRRHYLYLFVASVLMISTHLHADAASDCQDSNLEKITKLDSYYAEYTTLTGNSDATRARKAELKILIAEGDKLKAACCAHVKEKGKALKDLFAGYGDHLTPSQKAETKAKMKPLQEILPLLQPGCPGWKEFPEFK